MKLINKIKKYISLFFYRRRMKKFNNDIFKFYNEDFWEERKDKFI